MTWRDYLVVVGVRCDHRANAAALAAIDRSSGVMFAALVLPPFAPPSFPRATAAGFFSDCGLRNRVRMNTL